MWWGRHIARSVCPDRMTQYRRNANVIVPQMDSDLILENLKTPVLICCIHKYTESQSLFLIKFHAMMLYYNKLYSSAHS
jgi:hypothetical protein